MVSIAIIIIALLVPYMMLYYGQYRNISLDLSNNVNKVVPLIEKLDIQYAPEPYTVEYYGKEYTIGGNIKGGEDIFPEYSFVGVFEAEVDGVSINIDIFKGENAIDMDTFVSCAVQSELSRYNVDAGRLCSKIEKGENNGCLWVASPLIEYDTSTLNVHTGVYDGSFYISKDNKIYCCSYSCSNDISPIITAIINVKPKKITAEELINKFINVGNMYGISEMY
ncbi:MAG: hypothetical protein ACI4GC_00865 [Acutalibacteraceae bacterium]